MNLHFFRFLLQNLQVSLWSHLVRTIGSYKWSVHHFVMSIALYIKNDSVSFSVLSLPHLVFHLPLTFPSASTGNGFHFILNMESTYTRVHHSDWLRGCLPFQQYRARCSYCDAFTSGYSEMGHWIIHGASQIYFILFNFVAHTSHFRCCLALNHGSLCFHVIPIHIRLSASVHTVLCHLALES